MVYFLEHERPIALIQSSVPTEEGAGVQLRRVFGASYVPRFDPFLLLDHFASQDPQDYRAGFPWHPHRGFQTVTYMIDGTIEHQDTLGNRGVIESGDVQWMTAGSGIIHQEMPREAPGFFEGFQLWVNLPKAHKMAPPAYRSITRHEIPTVPLPSDGTARVIAGRVGDVTGPVRSMAVPVQFLDVTLSPDASTSQAIPKGHRAFAFVYRGDGAVGGGPKAVVTAEKLVLFEDAGEFATVQAGSEGISFLLVSGQPLHEHVAWQGSIVMNTDDEVEEAYRQLSEGTFVSVRARP